MFIFPSDVKIVPVLPLRVGRTQSNVSQPFSMAMKISAGSPMPSKCRGLCSGNISFTHLTAVDMSSFAKEPPIPKPSNSRLAAVPSAPADSTDISLRTVALSFRSSSYRPPWTTANNA